MRASRPRLARRRPQCSGGSEERGQRQAEGEHHSAAACRRSLRCGPAACGCRQRGGRDHRSTSVVRAANEEREETLAAARGRRRRAGCRAARERRARSASAAADAQREGSAAAQAGPRACARARASSVPTGPPLLLVARLVSRSLARSLAAQPAQVARLCSRARDGRGWRWVGAVRGAAARGAAAAAGAGGGERGARRARGVRPLARSVPRAEQPGRDVLPQLAAAGAVLDARVPQAALRVARGEPRGRAAPPSTSASRCSCSACSRACSSASSPARRPRS
jgi:hypothetical protein